MRGRVTAIGRPNLDTVDCSDKLIGIIKNHNIQSIMVIRMGVSCCGGLERKAIKAMKNSGKWIPWQVVTIATHGKILD